VDSNNLQAYYAVQLCDLILAKRRERIGFSQIKKNGDHPMPPLIGSADKNTFSRPSPRIAESDLPLTPENAQRLLAGALHSGNTPWKN
jgi:hypothetical protein